MIYVNYQFTLFFYNINLFYYNIKKNIINIYILTVMTKFKQLAGILQVLIKYIEYR